MSEKNFARIFAESLTEIGKEKNILNELEEGLKSLVDIFSGDEELGWYFSAHDILEDKKKEFVTRVFSGTFSEYIVNLLKSLIDHNCIDSLEEIYHSYLKLADSASGKQRVSVTTRFPLDDATREKIKSSLGEKLKKDIILKESTSEKILGGIIVKIDDLLIDGSLASHLRRIKNNLIISKVGSEAAYED